MAAAHASDPVGGEPRTAGATLHHARRYDVCSWLFGLGVDSRNSRMIVDMAGIEPEDHVLDVGCGTGDLTLTAAKRVGESGSVRGIDASPEMIEVARRSAGRRGSRATFEVALIEELPYGDSTFDVVMNRLMMHHLPEDLKRKGFAEVLRVLKPGGLLLATDFTRPSGGIPHVVFALVNHQMMQSADLSAIPGMLSEAGFVDVASGPTRSAFLGFVSGRRPQ
ncbi:MAG: methyltransferase domain-containing protein [Coriobacteriia bacterium]|nr:methyltransferase domain-containing protein [Coriobacteriia bacterium]